MDYGWSLPESVSEAVLEQISLALGPHPSRKMALYHFDRRFWPHIQWNLKGLRSAVDPIYKSFPGQKNHFARSDPDLGLQYLIQDLNQERQNPTSNRDSDPV